MPTADREREVETLREVLLGWTPTLILGCQMARTLYALPSEITPEHLRDIIGTGLPLAERIYDAWQEALTHAAAQELVHESMLMAAE